MNNIAVDGVRRAHTAGRTEIIGVEGFAVSPPTTPRQHEQCGKPVPGSIPTIVRSYKSAVTLRINAGRGGLVWQRNYYEHIIRNDASLDRIRQVDNRQSRSMGR